MRPPVERRAGERLLNPGHTSCPTTWVRNVLFSMPSMRTWTCLAAATLLAGCPSSDDDEPAGSGTATDGGGSTSSDPGSSSGNASDTDSGSTGVDATGSSSGGDTDTDTADPDTGSGSTTGGVEGCGLPVELGVADLGELEIDGFHVVGTRIAAAIRGDGVALLDASDPAAVSILGMIDPDGGPTYRAAQSGDYIVGGRRGGGAFMVDATDPANMVELWVDENLDTEDILYGDLLYLASSAGLSIVDVSTPDAPSILVEDLQQDAAENNIGGSTITQMADVLYMAGFSFTSIDVSTPATPTTLADVDDAGRPDNLVSAGGYVYVGGNDGVNIFDASDPASPVLVGTYPGERGSVLALDADTDRLFVFASSTTSTQVPFLRIVDVSDKANPVEVGSMYEDLDDPLWAQYEEGTLYFTTDATDVASLYILEGCPPPK